MSATNIQNYALVVESSPEDLVDSVTKAIGEGFQPVGGVSCVRESASKLQPVAVTRYAQALVRLHAPNPLVINGR